MHRLQRKREAAEREAAEEAELHRIRQQMRVSARPVPASVYKASFDVQRSTKPRECLAAHICVPRLASASLA